MVGLWVGCIYSTLYVVRPICEFLKKNTPFNAIVHFGMIRSRAADVAEGGPGRLAEVVQGAEKGVEVLVVLADDVVLEEVEEVGFGFVGQFPNGAWVRLDILGLVDAF